MLSFILLPYAQAQDIGSLAMPYFKTYTDNDGLPQNTIRAVGLDSMGFLWVGTQDGVAVYNGRTWTVRDMPNKKVSNFINQNALCAASDGSLWFGTRGGGLSRLRNGEWTTFTAGNGLRDDRVNYILETSGDSGRPVIWVATFGGGVSRLEEGQWTHYTSANGLSDNHVFCLLETSYQGRQTLWAGTMRGLSYMQDGAWHTPDSRVSLTRENVYFLLETKTDSGGSGLYAATSDGLWTLIHNTWKPVNGSPRNVIITSLAVTREKNKNILWMGTIGLGLLRYDGAQWKYFNTASGFADNYIFSLLAVQESASVYTLWVGTANAGLCRLKSGGWQTLDMRARMPHASVVSLLITAGNEGSQVFYVGTNNGIWKYDNGRQTVFERRHGLANNRVLSLYESSGGGKSVLWAGTDNGLNRLEGTRWARVPMPDSLYYAWIYDIAETDSPEGPVMWFASSSGLLRLSNNTWTLFTRNDGLGDNSVYCILPLKLPDKRTELWLGTDGGLTRYTQNRFTVYTVNDGLADNRVRCLLADSSVSGHPSIWAGTLGGVTRLPLGDTAGWITFTESTQPALPNNVIHQMAQDRYGRLYVFTNKGAARIERSPSGNGAYRLLTYGAEDGLPTRECNGRQAWRDGFGRIWAGTVKGLVMLNPEDASRDETVPALQIIKSVSENNSQTVTNGARLRYDQNRLTFEFVLLSYFRENETAYQTRLIGLEHKASLWTSDNKVSYTNLAPGVYQFAVTGKNYAGQISRTEVLAFEILPAPWTAWYAWVFYLTAGTLTVIMIIRIRVRWLKKRNEELEKKVEARTRQLRATQAQLIHSEKMASLGQLVAGIAHELNNPLSVIYANLDYLKNNVITDKTVFNEAHFLDAVEALQACAISTHRVRDVVTNLIKFSNLNESDFKPVNLYEIIHTVVDLFIRQYHDVLVINSLPPDVVVQGNASELGQCFRNILINAVQAIQDAASAGQITTGEGKILIESEFVAEPEPAIGLSVTDNGIGIPAEQLKHVFDPFFTTRDIGTGRGLGLTEAYGIVRKHQGHIDLRSEPGRGTTITVILPLNADRSGTFSEAD